MFVLIAGPYRSGTGDDPEKMAANLRRLDEASWPLFKGGNLPVIGEWVALPVWRAHGARPAREATLDQFAPEFGRVVAAFGTAPVQMILVRRKTAWLGGLRQRAAPPARSQRRTVLRSTPINAAMRLIDTPATARPP
jgi:hypothetical protein